MRAISDPATETIVFMTGAQIGKTEIINNAIGYYISQDPSPILVVQPTLDMSKMWSNDRLAPMLRDTPALKNAVKDPRSRDSGNTLLQKSFVGGYIAMVGANSPAGLASRPVRCVFFDEVDRFPHSAGTEGDPIDLGRKRTSTFTYNRKIVMVSTPTNKGASRIEAAYEESDQRQYYVPCHDCGHKQVLKWGQVQWEKDKPETASYICEGCGSVWDDADRYRAVRAGEWVAHNPDHKIAGFHLSGLYSPWTPLADAARDFLVAKKSPETLRVFVNTFLAETWEDEGQTVGDIDFQSREDDWGDYLPDDIVVITAGCDVQDDRIECELIGWGRDEESWSISYKTLYGDPSTPHLWNDLDNILKASFTTESGRQLGVRAACIDSGGHYTQAVYNFVRPREGRRIFAIKGMGGEQRPLVSRPTKNNIGKIKLFAVGTFPIKELIFSRLRIQSEGAGYCHFPAGRSDEYYQQLANSEKIVTKYQKGFPRRDFVKTRTRNEALDCRVYGYAALCILSLNINAVADRVVNAPEPETQPKPQQQNPLARRPKQGGFVNSWR
jgi:phage terminase large subunit GpA-like protein